MAAVAGHHWVALVLIASAAGEVLRDPTATWNTTTIKLIVAQPPLLTHPGLPPRGERATEEFPAIGPYRETSTDGVHSQLNSCCCDTSKTLLMSPSSTAVQGKGGMQASAATLNRVTCKPWKTYLARPAPNGQPNKNPIQ